MLNVRVSFTELVFVHQDPITCGRVLKMLQIPLRKYLSAANGGKKKRSLMETKDHLISSGLDLFHWIISLFCHDQHSFKCVSHERRFKDHVRLTTCSVMLEAL